MRLSIWLGVLALGTAFACGDDSDDDGSSASDESRAIAQALTDGIDFDEGLLRTGAIPDPSADTVRLSQDEDVLRLSPGDSQLMSLGVENPEEDPVESALIQFEDADDHVEVPAGEGDAGLAEGEISLSFDVDPDVCDEFCNKLFTLRMIQAVKLRGGAISRHLLRTLELDCTEDGDADLCEDDDENPDGGTSGESGSGAGGASGGGAGSGGGSTTTVRELQSALVAVDRAACMCGGETDTYCADAPYPMEDVTCIGEAVGADAALNGPASCLEMRLPAAMSACTCDDLTCYENAVATALGNCTGTAELETALEDCNFPTTAAAADASP